MVDSPVTLRCREPRTRGYFARLSRQCQKLKTDWRITQSPANCYPSKDSQLAGKNAGKILFLATAESQSRRKVLAASRLLTEIPYSTEQGKIMAEQGNMTAIQTIVSAKFASPGLNCSTAIQEILLLLGFANIPSARNPCSRGLR